MEKNEAAVLYHLHECEVGQGDLGSGKAKPTIYNFGNQLEADVFPRSRVWSKSAGSLKGRRKRRWFRSPRVCQGGPQS
jgi:hypothetical protein